MIKSMTGYGRAEALLPEGKITIEIKSLNSKNADINIKTSILPKDKELVIRQLIADKLYRGTIDFYIGFEASAADVGRKINIPLAKEYFGQIMQLKKELYYIYEGDPERSLWSTILEFPDIFESKKKDIIDQNNWQKVEDAINQALEDIDNYRKKEGEVLYKDVCCRIQNILNLENIIEGLEGERIALVREKLQKNLEELGQKVDENRFEQEIIYYLEKLDITEEKVRLRQHCQYFIDTINTDLCPGKKLGFILQEMGREINTTGSKANHAGIQQAVVKMKDELEKIKEQALNIL